MQTTEPAPSYEGEAAEVNLEMLAVPNVAALQEYLPQITDGRMSGSIRVFAGGRLAITAAATGNVDAYSNIVGDAMVAQTAGNDFKILSTKNKGTDYVVAAVEGITLEDLASPGNDLNFAISSPGAISQVLPLGVFNEEGLNPDNVNWVNVGSSSTRTQAVAAGRVDAAGLHREQLLRLQEQGESVVNLADTAEYFPNWIEASHCFTPNFLSDPVQEAWAAKYVEAYGLAAERAMNDFEWVFEWTQRVQAQPLDRELARDTWEFLTGELEAWPVWEFDIGGYENVANTYKAAGLLDESLNVEDMFDSSYFEQAKENQGK